MLQLATLAGLSTITGKNAITNLSGWVLDMDRQQIAQTSLWLTVATSNTPEVLNKLSDSEEYPLTTLKMSKTNEFRSTLNRTPNGKE